MLAVIGGSGIYRLDGYIKDREIDQQTPYGKTSSPIVIAKSPHTAESVCFLARHGLAHNIAPHKINYRSNIHALKAAGVSQILAINAVGSCNAKMNVGDYVLVDQCIDYSYGRSHTFHEEQFDISQHIDFTHPVDINLHQRLCTIFCEMDLLFHASGVYACTQGPRFETAAEVKRIQRDGGDVIGMTMMPEAALAREKTIAYASICVVVNPAAGLQEGALIDDQVIADVLTKTVSDVSSVVSKM